ncbi:MAG: thioredoxin family protein [Phycisphaerales bacterium]
MSIIRLLILAAVVGGLLSLTASALAEDVPPVFAQMAFEGARESTKGNAKILVVKATAEWCGPCKQMDKTTWRDAGVVEWVKANGLAIQVDVDKEPAIAKDLAIEAMPTMVVFKNGKEFDRIVGYRTAEQLLAWLADVKAGKRTADAMEAKAAKLKAGGDVSVDERYKLAVELSRGKKYDEATEQYVWLWKHMLETAPAMVGVRSSFMAGEMKTLAARHAPAKAAFAALRDEAEADLNGPDKGRQTLSDWVVLNDVLADEARTLAWFDRVKGTADGRARVALVSHNLDRLLEKHERWADMGMVVTDPLARLRQHHGMLETTKRLENDPRFKDRAEQMGELHRKMFRDSAAKLYASLLAAQREADATAVGAEAVRLDDTGAMRVALVEWALRAKQARPAQAAWLDEAKDKGEFVGPLRAELDAALKQAP